MTFIYVFIIGAVFQPIISFIRFDNKCNQFTNYLTNKILNVCIIYLAIVNNIALYALIMKQVIGNNNY